MKISVSEGPPACIILTAESVAECSKLAQIQMHPIVPRSKTELKPDDATGDFSLVIWVGDGETTAGLSGKVNLLMERQF